MSKVFRVKITYIIFLSFFTITLHAQGSGEFYGKLNQVFVPHNKLNGVGYTMGYQMHTNEFLSYKIEVGMSSAFRERNMNLYLDNIHYLDLYYNLAQLNVSFIPTIKLINTNNWEINAGLGLSGAYQSKMFITSHYEFLQPSNNQMLEVTNFDAFEKFLPGAIGILELKYRLAENWNLNFSTQYQYYFQGEGVLITGIGLGYRF